MLASVATTSRWSLLHLFLRIGATISRVRSGTHESSVVQGNIAWHPTTIKSLLFGLSINLAVDPTTPASTTEAPDRFTILSPKFTLKHLNFTSTS